MTMAVGVRDKARMVRRNNLPSGARVALALAHADGKRLLRHMAVIASGALTGLALWFGEGEVTDLNAAYGIGLAYFPLCAGVLLATNMTTLRNRRGRTEEIEQLTGTSETTRTIGYTLAGTYVSAAGCLLLGTWIVTERLSGAIGWPDPYEALMGPALIVGAGAVGVLLARFIPSSFAALPGIVAIGLITGALHSMESVWRFEWLAPWPGTNDGLSADAWPRPGALHLVYLLAFAALLALLAIMRHRRDGLVITTLLAALLVVGVTGWVQARPPSDDQVARAISWLTQPNHRCVDHAAAHLCVYPRYQQLLDEWARSIDPVLAEVPPDALPGRLRVEQLPPLEDLLPELPPAVRAALPVHVVDGTWRNDGAVHPEFAWSAGPISAIALSVRAASWAVGLPVEPERRPLGAVDLSGSPVDGGQDDVSLHLSVPCHASGQARAVVALWLTGRAHQGKATFAPVFNDDPDDGMAGSEEGPAMIDITPPPWLTRMPTAVLWDETDLRLAMELLEQPGSTAALHASWRTFTDPTTTSEQLARALGLRTPSSVPSVPSVPACR